MEKYIRNKLLVLGTILLFLAPLGIYAQLHDQDYGLSVGLLTGGDVYVAESDEYFDIDSGLNLEIFYDRYITNTFSIGGNFNAAFPYVGLVDDTVSFYELALGMKLRFSINDKLSYKPGLNLGYRLVTTRDIDEIGGVIQGLGINLSNEFQLDIGQDFTPFINLGFISQPAGGNEEFNATFSPIIFIKAGLAFH